MSLELEVLADHPRCYFPLTEGGESLDDLYADATGNGYDVRVFLRAHALTHVAGPLAGTSAPHFGLDGDGHADAMRSNVTAGLPTDGVAFTVEGWVNTASPYLVGPLIAWGPVGGFPNVSLDVYALEHSFDPTGPSFFVEDGTDDNYGAATTPQLFDGQWHHLVITDDGAGGKTYYRDGALVLSHTVAGGSNGLAYSPSNILCLGDTGQYGDCVLGSTFGDAALAHVAAYDTVLGADRVLCHWRAGNGLPCAQWVRLAHASGQGYWQTKGDVTEEWAGGVRRVRLPFATLSVSPEVLMGRDPDSGLPAYCPPPSPSPTPVPPVPVPTGSDPLGDGTDPCVAAKCGAALAMAQHLEDSYEFWRNLINSALAATYSISVQIVLGWIGDVLRALVVAEKIAGWVLTVFNRFKGTLAGLTLLELGAVLPPWDTTTVSNVEKVFFCALQCSGGAVSVSSGDLNNVGAFLIAHPSNFLGDNVAELLDLLVIYSSLSDWTNAVTGAVPSNLCNGFSCA